MRVARHAAAMAWGLIALIVGTYAASFFLVPHRIMLATSNRIGVRFASFRGKFRFTTPSRVGITVASVAASFALAYVDALVWMAFQVGLALFALYVLDFIQIERISKTITAVR